MMSAENAGPNGATMRVSDAEREAAAAELRDHYAAGRLTTEELHERLDRALGARTQGELAALMRDLPSIRPRTTPLSSTGQPSPGTAWSAASGYPPGQRGWGEGNGSRGWGPGREAGSFFSLFVAFCALAAFGLMAAFSFGLGGGRPLGIALLIAAFALLRRLLFRRRRARRARTGRGRTRRRS
jgi:Flp pilus assembly protein TadB